MQFLLTVTDGGEVKWVTAGEERPDGGFASQMGEKKVAGRHDKKDNNEP